MATWGRKPAVGRAWRTTLRRRGEEGSCRGMVANDIDFSVAWCKSSAHSWRQAIDADAAMHRSHESLASRTIRCGLVTQLVAQLVDQTSQAEDMVWKGRFATSRGTMRSRMRSSAGALLFSG